MCILITCRCYIVQCSVPGSCTVKYFLKVLHGPVVGGGYEALREAFKKKKIQNVNFFQIGLDPPAPPSKCKLFEEKKSKKKIKIFFFGVLCLYNFTNLYIEVLVQVSWLKRHSL